MSHFKATVFRVIDKHQENDRYGRIFDISMMILIIVNVITVVIESHHAIYETYKNAFHIFDYVSVFIFSVEYLLRIWTADLKFPDKSPHLARIRFIFSISSLVDLLAVIHFYIPIFFTVDLRMLRVLRLTRMLRVLKIHRYTKALDIVGKVLIQRKEELFLTMFVCIILILFSSTLMYFAENEVQPKAFPNITSAMWWSVVTVTTVGYGDVYPITGSGRLLAGVIAFMGIGLVALPTGIVSAGFMEMISKENKDEHTKYCSNCGHKIK